MTKSWKVTAQSTKGEVTTIIHCDDENEAWTRAERLFTGTVWNGIVERYPLYDDQAALIAELEATVNKLAALLKEGGEIVSEYKQREAKLIAALRNIVNGNYDNAHEISYARRYARAVLAEVMK